MQITKPYAFNFRWLLSVILLVVLFLLLLFIGSVNIPADAVLDILTGRPVERPYWTTIVMGNRLPMAIAALCCGCTLSVAGLMMQTAFANPLAGPSVLGVASGASLGVAVLMLGAGGLVVGSWASSLTAFVGALVGGIATVGILMAFSSIMKNGVMLLVVGIMISYLCSSVIALLNYFSPADEIRSYLVWGLGSYAGLQLNESLWFIILSFVCCIFSLFYAKPLNALLGGDSYAESVGYSIRRVRGGILLVSGILVAVPTAFCGPIGFIGLVVPHIARLLLHTSNHRILLPASIIMGGAVSLLCALLGVLPSGKFGVLPINVITPFIGIPVILYLLVKRNKILYFQ